MTILAKYVKSHDLKTNHSFFSLCKVSEYPRTKVKGSTYTKRVLQTKTNRTDSMTSDHVGLYSIQYLTVPNRNKTYMCQLRALNSNSSE